MKKQINPIKILLYLFITLLTVGGQACDHLNGDEDTPVPRTSPAVASPTGVNQESSVFDLNVDLIPSPVSPDTTLFFASGSFEELGIVLDSLDVVLAYRRTFALPDTAGIEVNYWTLLPQTLYFVNNQRAILYELINSRYNYYFYVSTPFYFPQIQDYVADQLFRLVIIPGETLAAATAGGQQIDYNNYDEVIKRIGLSDSNVRRIDIKTLNTDHPEINR